MSTLVFTSVWRQSSHLWHLRPIRIVPVYFLSLQTSSTSGNIFERLPKEQLAPKIKPRLRDRELLPGSTGGGFPEFLASPRDSFPLGVRVNTRNHSSLPELTARCMEYIEENLSHSPAILFRGLPADTADDFLTITQAMKGKPMGYEGGNAPRPRAIKNVEDIYYASAEPGPYTVELHHELPYSTSYPKKLFFFCLKEPGEDCGGETPLGISSEIVSKLDPEVVRKFEEKGVRYARYLPDKSHSEYMTWQQQLYTDDRQEAEERAKERGFTVRWDDNGDLYLSYNKPAFFPHPVTGEILFFNQAISHHRSYSKALPMYGDADIPDDKYPCNTYYGDGSEIEPEVLQHVRAVSWSCAVGFQWRKGDLLVMDNLTVRHGRMGFTGERKILVHMTAD